MNIEEIQEWVDKRFGKPNTFNTQLLLDFKDWLLEQGKLVELADNQELPLEIYHYLGCTTYSPERHEEHWEKFDMTTPKDGEVWMKVKHEKR